MTVVALCSAKASPGATTLALALTLTWPGGDVVLVEADPDGGDLAARLGLGARDGLAGLAAAGRRDLDGVDVGDHTQPLGGSGREVVCAPASADETDVCLVQVGAGLAGLLAGSGGDAVLDCGRLSSASPALSLAQAAAVTLVVCRPLLAEVGHVQHRVRHLTAAGCQVGLVVVGDRPYRPAEVAAVIDAPLVGVVADDPTAAAALNTAGGGDRRLRRSLLWRSAADLASALVATHNPPTTTTIPTPATAAPAAAGEVGVGATRGGVGR